MKIIKMFKANGLLIISSVSCFISMLNIGLYAWAPDIQPKLKIRSDSERLPVFFGNHSDQFKLLDQDDNSILIGARNAAYNLSLNGLLENLKERIEWTSSDADRELCALKGKQETDCQNYIRVFARINENQTMFCGTNSYKPRCRYYNIGYTNSSVGTDDTGGSNLDQSRHYRSMQIVKEIEAQGRCPYSPSHNSTYVFTDGQLYSATVADFSGADPLIYREPQRTEQYDLKQLNQPAFVSAVEHNGYVFFFFREIATEYMNCGKAIYSRVGRVCKNDKGGPYGFWERWTSYLKVRLNCSVPGEYPFYFDEIQSTSKIIDGKYRGNRSSIIYAVFTTSTNAIPGSAVCAFAIDDILESFQGRFKTQRDSKSNWLPLPAENVPEPRPGKCVDDSRTLSSTSVNFVKTHTLMENAVPSLYYKPLITKVSLQYRLSAIVIDPQIYDIDDNPYDVIFAGTDDGKVIKFVNIPLKEDSNDFRTVVITELQRLPIGTAVRELTISHKTESLIVIGDGHIVSVPLHHCSEIVKCFDCISAEDPYCVWDINNHECKSIKNLRTISSNISPSTTTASATKSSFPDNYLQAMNNPKNANQLCRKHLDFGNRIDQQLRPIVISATRGTVSSVGKIPHSNNYPEQTITLNTMDGTDFKNPSNINVDPLIKEELGANSVDSVQLASSNFYWGLAGVILILVFVIGILVGLYASKRFCQTSPFHSEHRNQLNSKSRAIHLHHHHNRNNGKDINLLMNTNPFPTMPCNNKKDNLEHEFGSEKDRSHECKNSTENLEKEVHSKTGTLTKVKRTYI